MPLYEYLCKDCNKKSEILVRSDTVVKCEHCSGTELNKLLSVFSIGKGGESQEPSCAGECSGGFQSGTCGSGMCGG